MNSGRVKSESDEIQITGSILTNIQRCSCGQDCGLLNSIFSSDINEQFAGYEESGIPIGCKCGIFSVRNENVTKHPTFQGSQEHPLHPALKEGLLLLALSQDI